MKLSGLEEIYAEQGPFATAYLDASRTSEAGAREVDRHWRALREQLEREGADGTLLAQMEERGQAPTGASGPCTRVLVGAGDRVLLDRILPDHPAQEFATWAALPDLLPLVRQQDRFVAHAVVSLDRAGAEITVYGADGAELERAHVRGDTENLSKSRGGDWAHRSMQARTEDKWAHNMRGVAERLDLFVRGHSLELVAVAGDEQATALLEQEASAATRPLLRRVGGSAQDGGDDALAGHVRDLMREQLDARKRAVLETFEQERGRHDAAAEGIGGVVDALRRAQVATLLVGPGLGADAREIHVSDDPTTLAVRDDDLADLGAEHVRPAPAAAAILRAAVASGADVLTLDSDGVIRDDVAALLRYSDASTVSA